MARSAFCRHGGRAKAFHCAALDEAKALRKEIAFFAAIKAAIVSSLRWTRNDPPKKNALKQILDNAIVADGVADIFALAGLDKPNIGCCRMSFWKTCARWREPQPGRGASGEIAARRDQGAGAQQRGAGEEVRRPLLETLRKYHNRAIETAQVIEELIQMAKEFQAVLEREAALGLGQDEIAFYDALANNESAVRELGDDILKKIAIEITENCGPARQSIGRCERVSGRGCVFWCGAACKSGSTPDQQVGAVELVLKQAESLSNEWSK
jgi:type I restriction enzyme R subunit